MGEDEDESSAVVAVVEDGDEEVEEEAHNVLLPAETIDRKESVELWKSRNETDVIVADHDVFGTDENDEDSLDSLLRYQPFHSNLLPLHQYAFSTISNLLSGWSQERASGMGAAGSRLVTALSYQVRSYTRCQVPGTKYQVPGVKIGYPSQWL